jgi:hypothetical protein
MDDDEFQTTFPAMSFPVFPLIFPPIVNAPLKVAVPPTVREVLLPLVPVIDKVAPEFTVRLLQTPTVVPETKGELVVPEGMVTLSEARGTPVGFQFVDVFQAVLVAPVHVFWAKALIETTKRSAAKKK